MSTSFVEYHGHGFWSWDGYLEHVLALLADLIGNSPTPKWLADLRDHWRAQSSGAFRGWIHPNLDEFLTNDERRKFILVLLQELLSDPTLTREAQGTARLIEALLRGEMGTDASSELNYMISGPQPYRWQSNEKTSEERGLSEDR